MIGRAWPALAGFAGMLLGVALFACAVLIFAVPIDDPLTELMERIDLLPPLAFAGFVSCFFVALWARRVQRDILNRLETQLASVRNNPAPHALRPASAEYMGSNFDGVIREAEILAGCYRKALSEVVQLQEKLDKLRLNPRPDGVPLERSHMGATHFVVGSSRHRMVARLAPNLHIIAATLPLRQFLGRSSTELLARSFLEVVHPEDAAAMRRSLQEALRDGESHNITFRVLAGDGKDPPSASERYLQMDIMTAYDEAGTTLHLRCHFVDITTRILTERELLRRTREVSETNDRLRQTNQDLERLKESYRDLYHHAPVLYFSLDATGNLVAFNETMLRTLGYPREEIAGKPYTNLLTPQGKKHYLADPGALQRPGEVETQWVKKDGTIIDVWIGTTTIRDPQGGFIRSRSAARDVSETRRLANDLRTKAEELSRAVAQLKRINQELEEFTHVVSHDLKEPLRTLEAFSTFLAQDYGPQLGTEGQDYISHLIRASRRLGKLIDDLLTLSRAGRVLNTQRPFAPGQIISTLLGDLHDLIARTQAQVSIEGTLPRVVGDPERVMQLLGNLISNGLKYNPSPEPRIVLGSLTEAEGDHGMITFFVRDNGPGIDPIYHEQIFRIFRRLHRQDQVEGTGAGLAICKKIVEAHGGRIWVESIPGQGATFYFTLPRYQAPTESVNGRALPVTAGR